MAPARAPLSELPPAPRLSGQGGKIRRMSTDNPPPITLPAVAQSQLWRFGVTLSALGGLVWRAHGSWRIVAVVALCVAAVYWLLYWPKGLLLDADGFRTVPLVPLVPRRKVLWKDVASFRAYTVNARGKDVPGIGYDLVGEKRAWWRWGMPAKRFLPIFAAAPGGPALSNDELAAFLNQQLESRRR
jgi:hypothetical protein